MKTMYAVRFTYSDKKPNIVRYNTEKEARDAVAFATALSTSYSNTKVTYVGKVKIK